VFSVYTAYISVADFIERLKLIVN